jgi:hypothetical protein
VSCAAPRLVPLGAGKGFRFAPAGGGASELDGVLVPFAFGAAAGVGADESTGVSAAGVSMGVGSGRLMTGVSDDDVGVDLGDA